MAGVQDILTSGLGGSAGLVVHHKYISIGEVRDAKDDARYTCVDDGRVMAVCVSSGGNREQRGGLTRFQELPPAQADA